MTRDHDIVTDQQVDRFVDGLMEAAERDAFMHVLPAHPEVVRYIQQQARIDTSLARLFPAEHVSQRRLQQLLDATASVGGPAKLATHARAKPSRNIDRAMRIAVVGLAASLFWGVVAWQFDLPWRQVDQVPFFEPRSLAIVYQEVIENGFEPYYECREAERFAATFQRRQGRALSLAPLPDGSRMLGLSYAGGLSRETTAMLCEIDGQPVIVFVDRAANDLKLATDHHSSSVKVHRVARDGLVFYEVSPFDSVRVIDFLIAEAGGPSPRGGAQLPKSQVRRQAASARE